MSILKGALGGIGAGMGAMALLNEGKGETFTSYPEPSRLKQLFGQKELNDVEKYLQGIPIERIDMNTGLDKYVKRKESDYSTKVTRDNPWRYDMSIDLDAKVKHKEAADYFRKNLPYVARALDNTLYFDQLMYGITKEYGLSRFKEAVDDIIHKINPMNVYDEQGNEPTAIIGKDKKGKLIKRTAGMFPVGDRWGAGDIDIALMSHFDYDRVFSKENEQEYMNYRKQKNNPYTKDLPQGDTMGTGDFR